MCHQSVGLVQREIEARGIRTVLTGHFPHIAERIRPPRMFIVDAPLGETFSKAYDFEMHERVVTDAIEFARSSGGEVVAYPPYVWDDEDGLVIPEGMEDAQPIIVKNPRAIQYDRELKR